MNGSIREGVQVTRVYQVSWSDGEDEACRIDAKELGILIKRGEAKFEAICKRPPQFDNDWWLSWFDGEIAFCFTVTDVEARP